LAPAAGPGWEEPTSQPYPKFLSGSDYVFTLLAQKGSACDAQAWTHTRADCRTTSDV